MSNLSSVLFPTIVIALAAIGALAAAYFGYHAFRRSLSNPTSQIAFTLQDMREMKESGAISEAEFNAMRAAMVEQARRAARETPSARKDRRAP